MNEEEKFIDVNFWSCWKIYLACAAFNLAVIYGIFFLIGMITSA